MKFIALPSDHYLAQKYSGSQFEIVKIESLMINGQTCKELINAIVVQLPDKSAQITLDAESYSIILR